MGVSSLQKPTGGGIDSHGCDARFSSQTNGMQWQIWEGADTISG